ncbi:MAG: hypothetical protein P9M14_02865 [Candidatus Alcyoniella australis]|nr:hypothetical protein [Candidatus Alcyoniella australis]
MKIAAWYGVYKKNWQQCHRDTVDLNRQSRSIGTAWTLMDNMLFLLRFNGRAWTKHGWMNRGSPLYSISYMDDANCFPKFDPLFLAGRTSSSGFSIFPSSMTHLLIDRFLSP